jgi:hypothetical protein
VRAAAKVEESALPVAAKTQALRGRAKVVRNAFHQDPVVGWLVVVGGAGLGAFRPIYEGNNGIGRAKSQRIPIDFGDDTISAEEQAYIRYDSADRSFLFVPNLSKTNIVAVNDKKHTRQQQNPCSGNTGMPQMHLEPPADLGVGAAFHQR